LWQEEREISWRGSGYCCWIWVWRWGKNEFVEGEGVFVEVEGESSAKGVSEDEFDEDKEYVANNDKTSDDYAEDESDFEKNWDWSSVIPEETLKEVNSNIVPKEIDMNLVSNMTVDVEVEILNSISKIRKI